MKRLVLKRMQKMMSVFLMTLLVIMAVSMDVQASESEMRQDKAVEALIMRSLENALDENETKGESRTLLYNCLMSVYCGSGGMEIAFSTDSVQVATQIGVKDVIIKQRVNNGKIYYI